VSLIAAREEVLAKLHRNAPDKPKAELKSKLVAYGSVESHCCMEKACYMAGVTYRVLKTGDRDGVNGRILSEV
jgi:glutamate/tyrosine decarboxylase-like PLP-dependent enzyme